MWRFALVQIAGSLMANSEPSGNGNDAVVELFLANDKTGNLPKGGRLPVL